jgi:hypothetical protein
VGLVTAGIGAITLVSLVLGWALLAVAEGSDPARTRRARAPGPARPVQRTRVAARRDPAPQGGRAARDRRPANTLHGMDTAPPRRRREPVSGQTPRVPRARAAAPASR